MTSLVSPDIQSENVQGLFGRNITYYKGYLAISEMKEDRNSSIAAGRVNLYKYDEINKVFNLHKQFENNESYTGDWFGSNVILNDRYMVIGTGQYPMSVFKNHKVYVYEINSKAWQNSLPDYRFASKTKQLSSVYGKTIAIKDEILFVGDQVHLVDENSKIQAGKIYGYRIPENPTYEKVNYADFYILPNEDEGIVQFGSDLSIHGNDLYIKAKDNKIKSSQNYILYKFDLNTINEDDFSYGNTMEKIEQLGNNTNRGFGSTIEIDNGYLILGSPEADTESGFRSGSVFTSTLQPVIESIPNLCNDMSEFELKASPIGGILSLDQVVLENNFVNISTLEAGEHTVSYSLNGCVEETTFNVLSNTVLQSKADSSITKCTNDEVEIFIEVNNKKETFAWYHKEAKEDDYQLLDSASSLTRIRTTDPGFYEVRLLNPQCNEIEEEFQIINHELFPELNLNGESEYCESEVSLEIENIESFDQLRWYFKADDAISFQKLDSIDNQIYINRSGDYYCIVESQNCEFTTNTVSVFFKPNPQDLFIPNVATLDHDGYNDSFRIKTDYPFKNFSITIYNRYGKEVYQSFDQDFRWYAETGYSGTFLYLLKYETECGEIGERKGWVQMIKE